MKKIVTIYDFDHTIYDGDASLDFIIFCLRRYPSLWKYSIGMLISLLNYILGHGNRKRFKQEAFALLKDLNDVDDITTAFWDVNEKKIKSWYSDRHKDSDIVISASPEFLLQPIIQRLGVKTLIATKMDKRTGVITGKNCRGTEKVRRLKNYDSSIKVLDVYSDSLSDKPIFDLATGSAYIVKGKDIIKFDAYKPSSMESLLSNKALLRELFLYGIIGVSTAALDVVLFQVLLLISVPLLLANFVSVSTAVGSSFVLNAKYNFKKTDNFYRRGMKFFSIGYFGWFVQSIILWIGVSLIGFQELPIKIFAVFVAAVIQYVLNKLLTFRD